MGERSKDAYRLNFDRKLKVEFHGTEVILNSIVLSDRFVRTKLVDSYSFLPMSKLIVPSSLTPVGGDWSLSKPFQGDSFAQQTYG